MNKETGDVLEVPAPDRCGHSVVRFNGRTVHEVLYADEDGGTTTTLEDGHVFHGEEWALYLIEQLRVGRWRYQA